MTKNQMIKELLDYLKKRQLGFITIGERENIGAGNEWTELYYSYNNENIHKYGNMKYLTKREIENIYEPAMEKINNNRKVENQITQLYNLTQNDLDKLEQQHEWVFKHFKNLEWLIDYLWNVEFKNDFENIKEFSKNYIEPNILDLENNDTDFYYELGLLKRIARISENHYVLHNLPFLNF